MTFPGSGKPLAAGETVVLTDRKGRRYLVRLDVGAQWHSHAGMLGHDDLIGAVEGTTLRTNRGMEVVALRPTREDFVLKMKRGAQVVYPKDQAMIVAQADIRPGMHVLEAGTGSGALALALLDAVGRDGRVTSIDNREDHQRQAAANIAEWLGDVPDNLELRIGDVAELVAPIAGLHRVVLDLLEPWRAIDGAADALATGGILLAYTPTIPQVMRLREALEADRRWAWLETTETIVRPWDVKGLSVRPAHRMVAHTAWLTRARRVPPPEDGGPPPPRHGPSGLDWSVHDQMDDPMAHPDGNH
ncbi:MAG: tRNA (adenine-N1)-methyltransferase [Nitriliruptorales bacterium]|nr:tRNA (adenine-N1)-methyltransferase [Nitriliruptorales bacterium]